ncbi:MAG: hypothetical protein QM714_04580 [Nocardioides sp.]|uniref:hypothetical protein n=1 Tax=Nocardioides sp. TaxID=35761 RepID=UPI0039E72AFC
MSISANLDPGGLVDDSEEDEPESDQSEEDPEDEAYARLTPAGPDAAVAIGAGASCPTQSTSCSLSSSPR